MKRDGHFLQLFLFHAVLTEELYLAVNVRATITIALNSPSQAGSWFALYLLTSEMMQDVKVFRPIRILFLRGDCCQCS